MYNLRYRKAQQLTRQQTYNREALGCNLQQLIVRANYLGGRKLRKISTATYLEHIIDPVLFPQWHHHCQQGSQPGYICFQQDGSATHVCQMKKNELHDIGICLYLSLATKLS